MALLATWIAPTTKEKGLHTLYLNNILDNITQIYSPPQRLIKLLNE